MLDKAEVSILSAKVGSETVLIVVLDKQVPFGDASNALASVMVQLFATHQQCSDLEGLGSGKGCLHCYSDSTALPMNISSKSCEKHSQGQGNVQYENKVLSQDTLSNYILNQ